MITVYVFQNISWLPLSQQSICVQGLSKPSAPEEEKDSLIIQETNRESCALPVGNPKKKKKSSGPHEKENVTVMTSITM